MFVTAFFHGLAISTGLIVAVGPQNVFVFQQGVIHPRLTSSLPTVLTASLADTFLILLGVLGVSAVVVELAWLRTTLLVGGIVFLTYVGWMLYSTPVTGLDATQENLLGVREQIGFTGTISLLNPHAILGELPRGQAPRLPTSTTRFASIASR
ncbi:MAG: Lysine efflux permease [halophilic archaeon J07HX5]|nr:MAG: Lysine efflux permease [halophilic archaeon J07HX5]